MQIKKSNNLILNGERKPKNSKANLFKIEVKKSNGDFISGVTAPYSGLNRFTPFSAVRKALITSKQKMIDGISQQNTRRKPWLLYRLKTSLPV
jgi:hypothetical protein